MSYDMRTEVGMATTPREELHRGLQDPEFRRLLGAALAKGEVAVALGRAIAEANDEELALTEAEVIQGMGITARMYHWLLQGDANPKIGDLGRWLAGMSWQLKMSIEPLGNQE